MTVLENRLASRWCLVAICLAAGLAGLSVAITGPILVDIADRYDTTVALAGQLMTIASLAGMTGTLGLSPLLDRIGRREAIFITLAVMALAALACAAAPSFLILCLAYGLLGMGGYTLLALALAAVGDLYQQQRLGQAMGWLVAGNMGVVVLVLPIMSTLADWIGWPMSFVFYAALASVSSVFIHMVLPAGLCPPRSERVGYLAAFGRVLHNRTVLALLLTVAVYHASVYGSGTFIGAVAIKRLFATTAQAGPILSARFFGTALAGVLAGRFLHATDWRLTAIAALACSLLSVAVYTAQGSLWWFALMALGHGATVGVMDVALNSLIVSVNAGGRGSITALRSVMDSLGGVVGPAMGGAIIAAGGYPAAGWLFAALALTAAVTTYLGARK